MSTPSKNTKVTDKNADVTPVMAAVGMTDLAVEKARELQIKATALSKQLQSDLEPSAVQAKVSAAANQLMADMNQLIEDIQALPATATTRGMKAAAKVQEGYADLAARGGRLVEKVKGQKATKDLKAQADATVAVAKGAVTSARKGLAEVEKSAKALATTGRHQAEAVSASVGAAIEHEAKAAEASVESAVKATRTAAKRTATTARKANARTTSGTKATAASVRKTAKKAADAAGAAADKLGK